MALLIKFGYNATVACKDSDVSGDLVKILARCIVVNASGPYNHQIYKPAEIPVELSFIDDTRIQDGESANDLSDKIVELCEEKSKLQTELYTVKNKLQKLEEAAAALSKKV